MSVQRALDILGVLAGTRAPGAPSQVNTLPLSGLERVGGLDGVLREWWVQPLGGARATDDGEPWQAVPIRNDFGLWLRRDPRTMGLGSGIRLRTRPVATRATRATLVLNAFAGYRLLVDGRVVAARQAKDDYTFGDLRHELALGAGAHEIVVEVDAGPHRFSGRVADDWLDRWMRAA